ncbi:beta-mannanase [Neobacillus cucumis]|uniref:Beta-mannanase n=1 Tax=Neobacillus cucumis TaxID=1740721 RepID=A0A2N5HFM9_9BACI|nr:beta-mannanase [Neobacillus cucumis]PLS04312.1 beta-mannanase [Neobacillus cucumis]
MVNWEPISSPIDEIKDIKITRTDTDVHVRWFWPSKIDFVYIHKTSTDKIKSNKEFNPHDLKLYTREEYKANQGYFLKLDTIGQMALRIFPGKKEGGQLTVFRQENEHNCAYISGSTAKVYFSITYKHKLFQTQKRVKMAITTELPLRKDELVYVKKSGGVPLSVEDGTIYPFIRDFVPGKTVLSEIEIDQHEFIQIFLRNGKDAAQHFELIPV